MTMPNEPAAIALDLGSTRFKLAALGADGNLAIAADTAAPELRGIDLIREGDAQVFLRTATRLIDDAARRWPDRPVGLVSQRSTFCVWDSRSGAALTPMISWQDRRASAWCAMHAGLSDAIAHRSGLLLSPHYVGPKLAAVQVAHANVARALRAGDALVGTLDTWLLWNWTQPRRHQTDLTMAARTALVDIERGDWSAELSGLFEVPLACLPAIRPTDRQSAKLSNGLRLNVSIADQAASAIAVLDPAADAALVNFGTGAFVLYPKADDAIRKPGYLTAPILAAAGKAARFALEGTINGAGPALDRFDAGPTQLPAADSCPDGFAIPDMAGIGSPHWREDIGLSLSPAAESEPPAVKRRIVLEGLLFRVREILIDLGDGRLPDRVLISGGAIRDPAIGLGLAQLLQRPIEELLEPETTLLGAARLAAGLHPFANPASRQVLPTGNGEYLSDKYARWRDWMRAALAG